MLERPEFHPLAARVATSLLALLTPTVCREEPSADAGTLTQGVDLLARQNGGQIIIACAVRVENRTASAVRLGWMLPQPPVASAQAVRVRLGERAASGSAYRTADAEDDARRAWDAGRTAVMLSPAGPLASHLTAGWLLPGRAIETTSQHHYALASGGHRPDAALRVQLAAALPLDAAAAQRARRILGNCRRSDRRPRRIGCQLARTSLESPLRRPAILGVLGRVALYAQRGVICHGRNAAVFNGLLHGVATRVLITQPPADAPRDSATAHIELERLLRAYRDPLRASGARTGLAHEITALGLRHGLVTPWTALLARRGLSEPADAAPSEGVAVG